MSNVDWTKEQKSVIDTRDKSILVAAGAGSGKTTVLVERILKMITDKENPVDIDRFLIVTFTRAAAAQMKEKIRAKLTERLHRNPSDENIRKQLSLVHTANISTIDSFSNKIVSEHFEELDIDPNFRVMEQEEDDMLYEDSIAKVLDEMYNSGDEEFLYALEMFAEGSIKADLSDDIKEIIKKANNQAFPKLWLEKAKDKNYFSSLEEFEKSIFVQNMIREFERYKVIEKDVEYGLECCVSEEVAGTTYNTLEYDCDTLDGLREAKTYDEYRTIVLNYKAKSMGKKSFDEKETAKASHELMKDFCGQFKVTAGKGNLKYMPTLEEACEDVNNSQKLANVLIDIAIKVLDECEKEKRYLSAFSFNDIAHFALDIICDVDEDGNVSKTETAKAMSENFHEILIDEYQDSNEIQECMLSTLSKDDSHNLFMVGDVKQSIYRFRSADPDIFLGKYEEFGDKSNKDDVRILLGDNFRSRPEIIHTTNAFFRQIMREPVGGIDYAKDSDLIYGAKKAYDLDVNKGHNDNRTEYVCMASGEKARHEAEAEFIAKRIKELMDENDGLKITNKDENKRSLSYKDIVILTKAPATVVDTYIKVLEEYGIPVFGEKKEGFYAATEIRTILDTLRIIDNPNWDIPLVGVMTSAVFGFTDSELSQIRIENKKKNFYEAVILYAKSGSDDKLKEKVNSFLNELDDFREKSKYLSVYELIEYILGKTYFEQYIKALPIGTRRKMNVDKLKEIAYAYENTAYRGLFNFIRYIDKNIENENDLGEAIEVGEEDDVVRIISIHKSKGLEFPVVFLANANFGDDSSNNNYLVDKEGNIATNSYDTEAKTKTKTFISKYIKDQEKRELKAEKLRLLYVALTRAKEKLIIVSSYKEKISPNEIGKFEQYDDEYFVDRILKAVNYHQMMAPVLGEKFYDELPEEGFTAEDEDFKREFDNLRFYVVPDIETYGETTNHNTSSSSSKDIVDEKTVEKLEENFDKKYKYEKELDLRSKMSVTEIKRQLNNEFVDEDAKLFIPDRTTTNRPNFVQQDKKTELTGAERGNMYHKVFELLDYSLDLKDQKVVEQFLDELASQNRLSELERSEIDIKKVMGFINNDIFDRMKSAYDRGELYRERKFLITVDGDFVEKVQGIKTDETMVVQGIIDALFVEDGQYVIVDYKTDSVDDIKELEKEYGNQLLVYKKAVEQITGDSVKEMIIYSVNHEDVVELEKEKV